MATMTEAEEKLAEKLAEIEERKIELEAKDADMRRRVRAARKRLRAAAPRMSLKLEPFTQTMRDVYQHLAIHNEVLLEVLALLVDEDEDVETEAVPVQSPVTP